MSRGPSAIISSYHTLNTPQGLASTVFVLLGEPVKGVFCL